MDSTRKSILGYFLLNPEAELSFIELSRLANNAPPQLMKRHCEKLTQEDKLYRRRGRDGDLLIYFGLSDSQKRMLKYSKPGVFAATNIQPIQTPINVTPKEETLEVVAMAPENPYKNRAPKGPNGHTRNLILELLESAPENQVTIKEIAQLFDISETVASKHLRNLITENKVKVNQKTESKHHLYQVIPKASKTQTPVDVKRLILDFCQTHSETYFTAEQISKVVNLSVEETDSHLKDLFQQHKLKIATNGRLNEPNSTKYRVVISDVMPINAPPVIHRATRIRRKKNSKTPKNAIVVATPEIAVTPLVPVPVATSVPSIPVGLTKGHIVFLKSIVQRLKDGQKLNEYDIQILDEHIESL